MNKQLEEDIKILNKKKMMNFGKILYKSKQKISRKHLDWMN